MQKELFLVLLIYFLVLFQQSFLPHFAVWSITPNLVLISIFLLNLLGNRSGIILAFFAGLILDIHSGLPLGISALIFLILAILIRKSSRLFQKSNIFYLIAMFSFGLLFYKFFLNFAQSFSFRFHLNLFSFLIEDFFSLALLFLGIRLIKLWKKF